MLLKDHDVFTVDHPAVAVELKVARPITYPLTQALSLSYEHNQVHVYFILRLLKISETVTGYSFVLTTKN